jgi:hypothetical protein
MQNMMPLASQFLPDKAESLDNEFKAILTELSTVEPILAHQISERHIISPIQQLSTFTLNMMSSLNIEITETDIQALNQLTQPLKTDTIDEMLNDLRADILKVAALVGKKAVRNLEALYEKRDKKLKDDIKKMATQLFEQISNLSKTQIESAPQEDSTEIVPT